MLLEKDFWQQAAYESIRGVQITHIAQEQINAGKMQPATEQEKRFALMQARVDRGPGAKSEHDIWFEAKKAGQKDRFAEIAIQQHQESGSLIPSTFEEIKEAKKSGEDIYVFGVVGPSQTFEVELAPMQKRVPYLPADYIEPGGLPPADNQIGGGYNTFAYRQWTGQAMTAAELWYRGTINNIPKEEIIQKLKAGISSGVMRESTPKQIAQAINQARADASREPYIWGPVDVIQMSRGMREAAKKAKTPTMQQNAPYTATSVRSVEAIPEVVTRNGSKIVVKPGNGKTSTQGMRRKLREASRDPVVDAIRAEQYQQYGIARRYHTWVRTLTPEKEVIVDRKSLQPGSGITKNKGGNALAVSKIGAGRYLRSTQRIKQYDQYDRLGEASVPPSEPTEKPWSTEKKVGVGVGVTVAAIVTGWGIKKLVWG